MKEKSLKSRKKSVKTVQFTNLNKRDFVKKFLKDTNGIVWPKEMSIVKKLWTIFPNESFWMSLDLKFKLNSLCWFLSDDGRKLLNTEYKKFNLSLEQPKEYDIEQNNLAFECKSSYYEDKPLNLRQFLNLWQKKTP